MRKNNYILLLVMACMAIFFVNLDAIYINIMEARNFITAREMLDDGNWLLTTLNGEPRYQKPPLPTWITAMSGAVFGLKSLSALRLPAAILALIMVLFSYKFSEKLTNNPHFAFVAALILASSFYIVFSGRNGQWDIYTHGFMMVCIYYLFRFFSQQKRLYFNALMAGLFFGLSFMSKGPVSPYALLLPFVISYGIVYRFKNFRSRIFPFAILVIVALIISSWWHYYVYTFDKESLAEITRRETSNWTGYNVRPFYYYWSFFTQSGIWTIPAFVGLLYPYLKDRVFDKKAYLFSFLWTIASVILLSVIPEKKSRYLMPVLIPLAFNTAFYIEYLIRQFKTLKNRSETIPVYFNFGLIALIGLVFPIAGYLVFKDQLAGNWLWFAGLSIVLVLIGFYMLRNLLKRNMVNVFYLTIGFIVAVMCLGMPMAKMLTNNPEYKGFAQLRHWQENNGIEVYEFDNFTPELVWDYGKPIALLKKNNAVVIPDDAQFGVLVSEDKLKEFKFTFEDYKIEKVTRYDMNPKASGESGYKVRLYRDLFVISKPTISDSLQ